MNRREFLRSFIVTAALVATAAAGFEELGSLYESNQNSGGVPPTTQSSSQLSTTQVVTGGTSTVVSTGQSSTGTVPSGYVFIKTLSALNGKSYLYFTHPTFGSSILLNVSGRWKAFSAVCTHRPCTVQYQNSSTIYCPCHGGTFSPADGSVTGGPPPTPLPEYAVLVQNNNVYVGNVTIN
jgi:Rieske Fe-S protein